MNLFKWMQRPLKYSAFSPLIQTCLQPLTSLCYGLTMVTTATLFFATTACSAKPVKSFRYRTIFEADHAVGNPAGGIWAWGGPPTWSTQVVHRNGFIYAIRVDADLDAVLVKIDFNGNLIQRYQFSGPGFVDGKVHDDSHNHCSIGIDKNNYIHAACNMHSGDPGLGWTYYISDAPENIASFTYRGGQYNREMGRGTSLLGLADRRISYPNFQTNRRGELYLTYRGATRTAWEPGYFGGHLARYDLRRRQALGTWKHFGVDPYPEDGVLAQAIVWTDWGRGKTENPGPYQNYRGGPLFFDRRDRMHLAWIQYGRGSKPITLTTVGASHGLYAFSNDNGRTFRQVDGTVHNFATDGPINEFNSQLFDVAIPGAFGTQTFAGATADGRPIVNYVINKRGNVMRIWNGSTWGPVLDLPGRDSLHSKRLISTHDGILITQDKVSQDRYRFWRSHDLGQTWQSYPVPHRLGSLDMAYLQQTGKLLYHSSRDGKFWIGLAEWER